MPRDIRLRGFAAAASGGAGNLSGDDRNVSYAWDPENRLASAIIPSAASPTFFAANATYQYDALGRRIAKTVNGQTTVYLCGGAQVLVEIDRKAIPSQAQLNGSESDGTVANASLPVASGGVLPGTGVIRINFQPATATIPAGYYADKGSVYGVRTNGMHYGWALNATSDVVARNGAVPVPELDTLALMDPTSSGTTPPANVWEVALPNGSYPVIVVAGDPLHRNQTNDLQIENQSVTDLDPSSAQTYEQGDYDGYAVIATVADGKLSISQRSGGINAKLCFVEIGPEGTTIDSATLTRLADLMQQATDHTALMPGATTGSREYVYGSYVDELISYTVGSDKYFVHANHLYSPSATTNAAGAVVERYAYDAYGKGMIMSAGGVIYALSQIGFSRGYTGYIFDLETGLCEARSRKYSPSLGKFTSRDGLDNYQKVGASRIKVGQPYMGGYSDGVNLYFPYFAINGLDPFGEDCGLRTYFTAFQGTFAGSCESHAAAAGVRLAAEQAYQTFKDTKCPFGCYAAFFFYEYGFEEGQGMSYLCEQVGSYQFGVPKSRIFGWMRVIIQCIETNPPKQPESCPNSRWNTIYEGIYNA